MNSFLLYHQFVIKKFFSFTLTFITFFISHSCFCQQISEYEAKGAFIIKVAGFIEWPENIDNQNQNFTISIIGDDPIEKILSNKIKNASLKIKGKNVILKKINSAKEAEGSQILFISSTEKYDLNKILKITKAFQILTIGDTESYAENGVMINMFIDESLKFSVNKASAEECGIYISSKLLAHAKSVIR
jgi:hypothetical protein